MVNEKSPVKYLIPYMRTEDLGYRVFYTGNAVSWAGIKGCVVCHEQMSENRNLLEQKYQYLYDEAIRYTDGYSLLINHQFVLQGATNTYAICI